jgi:hypothetical protein
LSPQILEAGQTHESKHVACMPARDLDTPKAAGDAKIFDGREFTFHTVAMTEVSED